MKMIDKSYEFKRKSLYWYSVLNSDSDSAVLGYSDDTFVDRYSSISAMLFNKLLSFETVVSPYTILNDEHTYKSNPYGNLVLPKNTNLSSFIRSKRTAFNKIGIKSIVHDTNLIGEMINQMEGSLKNGSYSNDQDSAIREHREGINSCLKYVYQIVKDDVENYERFRLKSESNINNSLKVMTENMSEVFNLDESGKFDSIPNSYLSHFLQSEKKDKSKVLYVDTGDQNVKENQNKHGSQLQEQSHTQSELESQDQSDKQSQEQFQDHNHTHDNNHIQANGEFQSQSHSPPDSHTQSQPESQAKALGSVKDGKLDYLVQTTNVVGITVPAQGNLGSLNYQKGVYNISTNFIDNSEMEDEQVSGTVVQQHARMVSSINDQLKAAEIRTINSVQERIAEISSMFVKFTGAVEGQNESFIQINENVQESLTNIEKTQETLKKTSKEGLPFYHRILCYSLAALSVFLLFIDYLKSSKGSYLF